MKVQVQLQFSTVEGGSDVAVTGGVGGIKSRQARTMIVIMTSSSMGEHGRKKAEKRRQAGGGKFHGKGCQDALLQ